MIEIRDMHFGYPRGGFSLRVPKLRVAGGETCMLTGPSGCGKTTLLNLVTGLLRPDSGSIRVGGLDLGAAREPELRRFRLGRVGYISQDLGLLHYLDALDNVLLPYFLNQGLRLDAQVRDRARAVLARLGVDGKARVNVERLSQGERQRVTIARALVNNPSLVVADEPTGHLDPDNARRTVDLLLEQVRGTDKILVLVTHQADLFEQDFDHVVRVAELGGGAA